MQPFRPDFGRTNTDRFGRWGPLAGLARRYQLWNWSWRAEIALRYAPVVAELNRRGGEQRVLDVGCGSKGGVTAYWKRPACGIDLGFDLERSRAHPLLQAVVGSGTALPFPSGAFDAAVSVDTIEHLGPKERLELVSELARVTASHGFVAVGAPCGAAAREAEARLASEFREKTGREHPRLGEHLAQPEMSADELEQLVAAAAGPRFGRYKLSVVANMGVTAWYRLQRLTDLGRPLPWVTHAHRLIFQPSFPLYAGRLNAEPTYRRIIFVSAEA